jgi:hypothetical protein
MKRANNMTNERYILLGSMSRKQAEQVAELLAGGTVVWQNGYTYPDSGLVIGPAPSSSPGENPNA